MASNVIATLMTYTGSPGVLSQITPTGDGNGLSVSMRDFELDPLSALLGLNANSVGTRSFTLCLQLAADAPDSLMGLTWLGTFTFTLHQ